MEKYITNFGTVRVCFCISRLVSNYPFMLAIWLQNATLQIKWSLFFIWSFTCHSKIDAIHTPDYMLFGHKTVYFVAIFLKI